MYVSTETFENFFQHEKQDNVDASWLAWCVLRA
jgi:hypothetical protein